MTQKNLLDIPLIMSKKFKFFPTPLILKIKNTRGHKY